MNKVLRLKEHFRPNQRTHVMGILNVTPDSFSGDGVMGAHDFVTDAVRKAVAFCRAGADILDVGGESTRPGAATVDTQAEIDRGVPVIEAITEKLPDMVISIDTSKAAVAAAALSAGAAMLNDVWGLQHDPNIVHVAAAAGCPVVLMHNASRLDAVAADGTGGRRYGAGVYTHLMEDITRSLEECASAAEAAGIASDQIILDPGIGFGKSVAQNLALLNHLDQVKKLQFPVLIGPSRKSFIGSVLGVDVDDRLDGTIAAVVIAITRGANIVRVHDVKSIVRAVRMCDAILGAPADGDMTSANGAV